MTHLPMHRERALLAHLRQRLLLARMLLAGERLWRAVWPAALLLGAYMSLALFGLIERLPAAAHVTLFALLVAGLGLLLWTGLARLAWPTDRDARRRLEADGGASHRPLDALFDTAATAAGGAALWRRHRARMAAAAESLGLRPPRLSLVAEDPRALRTLVAFLLLVGLIHAGGDSGRRLAAGFAPPLAAGPQRVTLDAWLAPPDYTGESPIMLRNATDGPVESLRATQPVAVPEGSRLIARLHGGGRAPVLEMAGEGTPFTAIGRESFEVEAGFAASGTLEIRQGGRVRGSWPIEIRPDEPPVVGFAEPPGQTRRQALRISYTLFDDYGVDSAELEIEPTDFDGAPLILELRGAMTRGEPVTATAFEDLTAHAYAGSEVRAVLRARDALGQEAVSDPVRFALPEREFTHPVAQRLAQIRKSILRMPERRQSAARALDEIARDPGSFDDNLTVYAALRSAFWRLVGNGGRGAVEEVADTLWDTALALEDGQLSLAMRSLREALGRFEDAIAGEGGDLAQAADELERMLGNFLSELARTQADTAPQMMPGGEGRMEVIGTDMLQRMIRRMRELAAEGETEAAMQMLAQLRDLMENATVGGMSPEEYRRVMAASRAARDLERLRDDQRDVLNETGRQTLLNRLLERSGRRAMPFDGLRDAQKGLSQSLTDLESALADGGVEAPGGLGAARQAMDDAAQALSRQSGPGALKGQADAVRAMDEAAQALAETLEQAMAQMPSSSGLDPLGRPRPGLSTRDYGLPGAAEEREAARIMEELRRRIADPGLSDSERHYLRRLLRRF